MTDFWVGRNGLGFRTEFLEMVARQMRPRVYVEIGLGDGDNFRAIQAHCEESHAVDLPPGSDAFFAAWPEGKLIDLCFVDGDHSAEQSLRDTENAMGRLAPYGLVVMHDTFPPGPGWTVPASCHTAWQAAREVRARHPEWEVLTLPIQVGLTLVKAHGLPPWMNE